MKVLAGGGISNEPMGCFGVKLYMLAPALGLDYLSLEACVPVMFGSASSKELPNLASFASIKSGLFVLRICILYDFFFPSIVQEAVLMAC